MSRNFEKIFYGQNFDNAPIIAARICARHSISHQIASAIAIEKAASIEPSEQTVPLRKLLLSAEIIFEHANSLYFLSLPAILGDDTINDFIIKNHTLYENALELKNFVNNLIRSIGGRRIILPNLACGTFTKMPKYSKMKNILINIDEIEKNTEKLINIFSALPNNNEVSEINCSLYTKNQYPLISDEIMIDAGKIFNIKDFRLYFYKEKYKRKNIVTFKGKNIISGPISRLRGGSVRNDNLNSNLNNGLAQALEINYLIKEIRGIALKLAKQKMETPRKITPQKFHKGVGAVESAEGIILHHCEFGDDKTIKKYEIITPSDINFHRTELLHCPYCTDY